MRRSLAALLALAAGAVHAAPPRSGDATAALPDAAALRRGEARYAPVDLRVDLSTLPASDRVALAKLVAAARIVDAIFLRQVWAGNEAVLLELAEDASPLGRGRLAAFLRDKGPWDRLEGDRAFLPGVPAKPEAANFYPAGATKAEVEGWLAKLAPAERKDALGFFTTIRRAPGGGLTIVPYAIEYQGELARAAALLREAADATAEASLRKFLVARAEAFVSRFGRRLDAARLRRRADGRAVRGLRGRLVRREGGLRGVRRGAGRQGDREAGASARSSKASRMRSPSTPRCGIRSSAPWRRSGS